MRAFLKCMCSVTTGYWRTSFCWPFFPCRSCIFWWISEKYFPHVTCGEFVCVVDPGGFVRLLVLSEIVLFLWRTRKAQGKGWLSFVSPQSRTIPEALTPSMLSRAAEHLGEPQLHIHHHGKHPPSPSGPSRRFSQHMPWPDCTQLTMVTFRCGCSTTAGPN